MNLEHLPIQKQLIQTIVAAFESHENVLAGVLLGSLAKGTGDRVSDADVLIFTQNGLHSHTQTCFSTFESNKSIFYQLEGTHTPKATFKKYIFHDLTSAEIHCLDITEPFEISHPFHVLFDKQDIIRAKVTSKPAPRHEDFPVYSQGDEGLIWELFDCIKWLSRGHDHLAKDYLKRLAHQIQDK